MELARSLELWPSKSEGKSMFHSSEHCREPRAGLPEHTLGHTVLRGGPMPRHVPRLGLAATPPRSRLLHGRLRGARVLLWGSQVLGRGCVLLHKRRLQHRRQRLLQVLLQRHLVGAAILAALALPQVLQVRAGCRLMHMQVPIASASSMQQTATECVLSACNSATHVGAVLVVLGEVQAARVAQRLPGVLVLAPKGCVGRATVAAHLRWIQPTVKNKQAGGRTE